VRVRMPQSGRVTSLPRTHAHRFRHTFATWAIENDARELDVQYVLGHSTPAMVWRYSATYKPRTGGCAAALPGCELLERLEDADVDIPIVVAVADLREPEIAAIGFQTLRDRE
jgi:predicted component of type VI protein secretion system